MKDKLRELAERWNADADIAAGEGNMFNGGLIMTKQQCAAELLATLDAEGDGGAVAKVRHFGYHGIARNGFSQEAEMLDSAPVLPDGTLLYTHPARSGVVSDDDVEACVVAMKEANAAQWNATKDVTWSHGLRAALEHFAKSHQESQS